MIDQTEIRERDNKQVFIDDMFKTKKVVDVKLAGETNYHAFTRVIFTFEDQTELTFELGDTMWNSGLQIRYKSLTQLLSKKLELLTSMPTK